MGKQGCVRWFMLAAAISLGGCESDHPVGIRPQHDLGFDPWAHLPTNPGTIGPWFAPFVFQDIDQGNGGIWLDALTNFTYDNDWAGGNNWDNVFSYPERSHVYASITETADFYFVYYSFFHARDYSPSVPFGIDNHENDQESMMIVVDKAYTSATWPYGTPVIVETHDHEFPDGPITRAYRNCAFSNYTISERWQSFEDQCIQFIWDDRTVGVIGPHYRTAIYIEAHGHGVSMHTGSSLIYNFGGGDGWVYLPGTTADVPQYPDGQLQYTLISLLTPELQGQPGSLWTRRLSSGGYCSTSTYDVLTADVIGPYDVTYGGHFKACDQTDNETSHAEAPWAEQPGGSCFIPHGGGEGPCVLLGDWHNHGAWTLVRHFSSTGFPYSSDVANRQDTWMYWYNPFAAPEGAPAGMAETGGGSCGSADAYNCTCDPAITPCATLASQEGPPRAAAARAGLPAPPSEQFRVNLGDPLLERSVVPGAPIRGWSNRVQFDSLVAMSPAGTLSAASLNDGGWGYDDSIADVLVVPAGDTVGFLPLQLGAEQYPYLTIRVNAPDVAHTFKLLWEQGGSGAEVAYAGDIPLAVTATGWRTVTIYLLGNPGWLRGSVTDRVRLVLPQGGAIDFVAFHT